ncbi:carbohydrate ABC transporter permease [Myceligenerans pegani]|uniref:Carbohydrate ABC transporter permease n=1 Tax=Myceligenerans pegani TaxID=2776917 RepID=A0ABR9N407_9MICO|nr:carbohydrate ABC transporter permease [Myceligenerans sp. TRM 65318]MBE1878397.1 carbohydrate ABC transporter permease [Myceligenerans sp. TRM 65318]MBE3020668.1 carbohydrate ABC transporter permease [Myceligenerans sp. TRM 65318]
MTSIQDAATPPVAGPGGAADDTLRPARRRALRYLALYLLALVFVSPLLYMLVTSFKTRAEAAGTTPSWIPDPFTLQAYGHLLAAPDTPVLTWFANSLIAAGLNAALVVATASLAAYPLARMEFRGKRVVFGLVIAMLMVPGVILVIPNYLIVSELGWLNSLTAIIVPTAASAFGVFFMRQFFVNLPGELEEAALLDGANRFQVFVQVVVPLARPAMATLALLAFLTNWNDFLWPVYVLFSPETRTLPAGLATLQGANQVRYDVLMAGAVIASVPVMLLFSFLQRFIIEGVSRSGLKG